MENGSNAKYEQLLGILSGMGRVAVAFSGGIDSAVLLYAAREARGGEVLALSATSAFFPQREAAASRAFCERIGVQQQFVAFDCLAVEGVAANGPDRCYRCKRALMALLRDAAGAAGAVLVEGSNASDAQARRPGAVALAELGIASPLAQAQLTKADVRAVARMLGLPEWDKPAAACLATRFPYGQPLTEEGLRGVEAAEQVLHDEGFSQVRVRAHGNVARVEVLPEQMERMLDGPRRERVYASLRALGFDYTALDLLGYRLGSADEVLKEAR